MTASIGSNLPRQYNGFSLQGKKKQTKHLDNVIKTIKEIHRSVGWSEDTDDLMMRSLWDSSKPRVFAISPTGKILGYAIALRDNKAQGIKGYNISFIAVNKEIQRKGIGNALLLRIFEKIIKSGGRYASLEFEDTPQLCNFYQNPSIPYVMKLERNIPCSHGEKNFPTNKIRFDLTKRATANALIGKASVVDLETSAQVEIVIKIIRNPYTLEFAAFLNSSDTAIGRVVFEELKYLNGVYGSTNMPAMIDTFPLGRYGVNEGDNLRKDKIMISFMHSQKKYQDVENVLVQALVEYSFKKGCEGRVVFFNMPSQYFRFGFRCMHSNPETVEKADQFILEELKASELEKRPPKFGKYNGLIGYLPPNEIESWKDKIKSQSLLL